ncbi:MAG: hypothetical protein M0R80_00040 [Proteobacteria bacterium]|jgi:hypothetical protein|nr:hypothetical protein [Pseudomonadota bacterium]
MMRTTVIVRMARVCAAICVAFTTSCGASKGGLCGENGTDLTEFIEYAEENLGGIFEGKFAEYVETEMTCSLEGAEFSLEIETMGNYCEGDPDTYEQGTQVDCSQDAIRSIIEVRSTINIAGEGEFDLGGGIEIVPCDEGPSYSIALLGQFEEAQYDITYESTLGSIGWTLRIEENEVDCDCKMVIDSHQAPSDGDGGFSNQSL